MRRILTPSAMPGGARLTVRRLFAVEFASDTGLLADVPETVALYFDYEAYARDLFLDSFTFIDGHRVPSVIYSPLRRGYGLPCRRKTPPGRLTPA